MMILPAEARSWPDKEYLRAKRCIDFILDFYPRSYKEIRRKPLCLRRINTNKPTPWPLAVYPGDMVARLVKNGFYLRQIRLGCYVLR